jgi:hypothetical protein
MYILKCSVCIYIRRLTSETFLNPESMTKILLGIPFNWKCESAGLYCKTNSV